MIDRIDLSDEESVKKIVHSYVFHYVDFLKNIKYKKNIYIVSFDYFIANQEKSLISICSNFNFEINKNIELSIKQDFVFNEMQKSGDGSRVPHEKSKGRIYMDSFIKKDILYKQAEDLYSDILQLTRI